MVWGMGVLGRVVVVGFLRRCCELGGIKTEGDISFKKLTKVESCLRLTAPDNKQNTSAALVLGETMAEYCAVQLRTYPLTTKKSSRRSQTKTFTGTGSGCVEMGGGVTVASALPTLCDNEWKRHGFTVGGDTDRAQKCAEVLNQVMVGDLIPGRSIHPIKGEKYLCLLCLYACL